MKFVILAVALASLLGCESLTAPPDEPLREGLEVNFVDHMAEYGVVTVYGKQFGPRGTYGPDSLHWRISTIGHFEATADSVMFPPAVKANVPMNATAIQTIYVSIWTHSDTLRVRWPADSTEGK